MSSTFRVLCNDNPTPAGAVACLLVGEPLTVRVDFGEPGDTALSASPLTAHLQPEGATLTIDGTKVTGFTAPGAYKLKVTFADGRFRWLEVFAFESRVLDLVPAQSSGRSAALTVPERRRVLRALAQDPARSDGTFAALTSGGLNLAPFGA